MKAQLLARTFLASVTLVTLVASVGAPVKWR